LTSGCPDYDSPDRSASFFSCVQRAVLVVVKRNGNNLQIQLLPKKNCFWR